MSDEKTTGITGSQAGAATAATSARTVLKTKAKKLIPWFGGALVVAVLLLWWTGGSTTSTTTGDGNASIWWLALIILAILGALGRGGKGGKAGLAAAFCVIVFYVGQDIYEKVRFGPHRATVVAAQQQQEAAEEIAELEEEELSKNGSLTKQPSWEGAQKGSLPVGVWSAPVMIEPNCRLHLFLDEEEKVFSAEWQDYKGQWHALKPNQHLNQSQALRFMVKEEGVVSYPYKKTCS